MVRLRVLVSFTAALCIAAAASVAFAVHRLIDYALDAIFPEGKIRPLFELPSLPMVAAGAPLAYAGQLVDRPEAAVPRRSAARFPNNCPPTWPNRGTKSPK